MHTRKRLLATVLTIVGSIVLIISLPSSKAVRASDHIRLELVNNANNLLSKITELESESKTFATGNGSANELRNLLRETRLEYKKCEFLLEYLYPKYVKGNINGAPLYHLDPYTPRAVIHAPKGLQRLDELIQTNEVFEHKEELKKLTHSLYQDFKNLHKDLINHPLLDYQIFEASRLEIIRIFTLGVTGFDTPGSLNALEEASTSLISLKMALSHYHLQLNKNQRGIALKLTELFDRGIDQLKNNGDFEAFDRLQFLTEVVNPLYSGILELQKAIKLETPDEVSTLKKSINYSSKNIFDENFLNPYFYTKLNSKEDGEELRELGEKLFYEKRLSSNGKLSCSSCHHPSMAFTDGQERHISSDGKNKLMRNSPSLLNAMYSKRFFADMRAFKFDDQIEHVIVSHQEFNTSYEQIFEFLLADEEYRNNFQKVFKDGNNEAVSRNNFSLALVSYMISLKSFDSPFDKYVRGESKTLDSGAKRGFNLFMGKAACGTCHFAPTFAGLVPPIFNESESEVLGVLQDPNSDNPKLDNDKGRIKNGHPKESVWIYDHSFKTPSVRNIELTAPYFHNGAYSTLAEVMDFYNNGGGAGLGLELDNQTLPFDSLSLTELEKKDIIEFMLSLTDTTSYSKVDY